MRSTQLLVVVLAAAAACSPLHGTAFQMRYEVVQRKVLLHAVDAAREMHYSIVAVESPDVYHNQMLAFAEGSPSRTPTALLIDISETDGACSPLSSCVNTSTHVQVTPLAFRDGKMVPDAQVPPQTRAHAEPLMTAIYDRARGDRAWRSV